MRLIQFFKGFKKGMHDFGSSISIIVNSILLSIVYFIGIGLTFVFARLFRKHFLDTKLSRLTRKTYWSELNLRKRPIREYYRQF